MPPDDRAFQIATWLIPLVVATVLLESSQGRMANATGDPFLPAS